MLDTPFTVPISFSSESSSGGETIIEPSFRVFVRMKGVVYAKHLEQVWHRQTHLFLRVDGRGVITEGSFALCDQGNVYSLAHMGIQLSFILLAHRVKYA